MKINLPGQPVPAKPDQHGLGEFGAALGAEVVAETLVSIPERGRVLRGVQQVEVRQRVEDTGPDDVLELRWEGGIFELVSLTEALERYKAQSRDENEISIPTRKLLAGEVRGGKDILLEAIRYLRLDPTKQLTRLATATVVHELEQRLIKEPGVHRLSPEGLPLGPVAELAAGNQPYLALIHGTFSNTEGSFGDLFKSADWDRLKAHYGDRIVALEQRTLTDSPAKNALDLANALPENARLHMLGYSRGGLVGELLCRYPWTADDRALERFFESPEYELQRKELTELSRVLGSKAIRIERFARVGCPAAGTVLASKRLDAYLNVILSLLGSVAGVATPVFSFVKAVALAIVSSRTEPDAFPGLEAMMPHLDRGFVPFLNVPGAGALREGDELAVIAGDVEGGGFFDRLKAFFSDLYFLEDNDFVVDSKSMFRGVPRLRGKGFYQRSPLANHFSYFSNRETRECATEWLVEGKSALLEDLQVSELYGGLRAAPLRNIPKKTPGRPIDTGTPVVFLLPGIMGTHLAHARERIWLAPWQLTWGGLEQLEIDRPGVMTDGLIENYYEKLFDYLGRQYRVEPFAYDWRRPIKESADVLARAVELELDSHQRTIYFMAHSMGGLVCRTLIAYHRDLWNRAVARGGRLVMLGTPNHGSYVPAQVLTREHALMKWLARIDVRNDLSELTELVRNFSGLLEMLPQENGELLKALDPGGALAAFAPEAQRLKAAREFRRELAAKGSDPGHMVYVAGRAIETPAAIESAGGEVQFLYTSRGDGTVPWLLGRLEGVPTYYVDAEHGQIPNHERSFEGFLELLATGITSRLATSPSSIVRGEQEEQEMGLLVARGRDAEPRYYPSVEDLTALIYGKPMDSALVSRAPLSISIKNGDVAEATYPVLVGHYTGDKLVSVERTLDRKLNGALSERHRLDAYPGEIGTFHVAEGAIIVGLGQLGELTPAKLTETVTRALIEHALSELRTGPAVPELSIGVSSVLIGTYGGARINVETSIEAMAAAAARANDELERAVTGRKVRIDQLEFIEIYEDIATEAAHAARRVAEKSGGAFSAKPRLEQVAGFLRSRPRSSYATGWSRRVSIRAKTEEAGVERPVKKTLGPLEFEVVTDLARTEPFTRDVNWDNVDPMLSDPARSDAETRAVLFRYLLPQQLVGEVARGTDLVLVLDPRTARIPWELLGPVESGMEPLGVRFGVLRQLSTVERRERPQRSTARRALVIGNPAGVEPSLTGARDEARAVAELLSKHDIDVVSSIEGPTDQIFSMLWKADYDFIHIAAHGEYAEETGKFGVVLAGGRRLTSTDFDFPSVPSVVFLNCCHLGAFQRETALKQPGQLAASVAEHLIRIGVRVVIAAGWAVSDRAATVFATSLYSELLDGRTLMDAVRLARRATYRSCGGNDLTWGAYQVYGAEGFVLTRSAQPAVNLKHATDFASVQEFLDFVSDYGSRSRRASIDDGDANELVSELTEVAQRLPQRWREQGEVAFAVGMAYSELKAHPQAIEWLTEATKGSRAPLQAVEELANSEARHAIARFDSAPEEARKDFQKAVARLEGLIAVQPTPERYSLLGGTLKRWALTLPEPERKAAITKAHQHYQDACKKELNGRNWYYPASNAKALLLTLDPKLITKKDLDEIVANAEAQTPADFWSRVAPADAKLIGFLARIDDDEQRVAESYLLAFNAGAGATPRERESIQHHLTSLVALVPAEIGARVERVKKALFSAALVPEAQPRPPRTNT